MKNHLHHVLGQYKLIALALLLFIIGTTAVVHYLRPAITPPRVTLTNSKEYCTVGLGFSPDGKTFVGVSPFHGGWGGPIRIWDVQSGQERVTLLDNQTALPDLAFSPKSDFVAMETGNGELILWDLRNGKESARFEVSKVAGISHWRPNFAFSPDGQTLAFENQRETAITLWDLASKRERARLRRGSSPFLFSPDGQTLATGFQESIRFWEVATGEPKATTRGRPVYPMSGAFAPVTFSPDGHLFALSTPDWGTRPQSYQVILWNASDGEEIIAWETQAEVRYSLSFSPDGQVLTGYTADARPPCWKMSTLTMAPSVPPTHFSFVAPISPDQKTCAIPGGRGEIILWDLPRGKIRNVLSARDLVWNNGEVSFSPDNQTLAYGFSSIDKDDWLGRLTYGVLSSPRRIPAAPSSKGVKLLDIGTGKVFATFEGANGGEFSPDGKLWAMHGTSGTIQIWDVPDRPTSWPILVASIFGLLAAAILFWGVKRILGLPMDRSVLSPIGSDTITSP